jgi:hypothetical protein
MTDITVDKPTAGSPDYITKIPALIDTLQSYITILDAAMSGFTDLDNRLDDIDAAMLLRATLASPTLTGSPRAPTQANGSVGDLIATLDFCINLFTAGTFPAQTGNAGKVFRTDGANGAWADWWGAWTDKSGNFNAAARTSYDVDSTSAAFAATLPATPADGDWFVFRDQAGQTGVHPVTLGHNGNLIDGQAADFTIDVPFVLVLVIYRTGIGYRTSIMP